MEVKIALQIIMPKTTKTIYNFNMFVDNTTINYTEINKDNQQF